MECAGRAERRRRFGNSAPYATRITRKTLLFSVYYYPSKFSHAAQISPLKSQISNLQFLYDFAINDFASHAVFSSHPPNDS